ncbi:serine hydrolase domain-containing protein [Acidibrevibacterium fodinaquatile]|uniref:serine hydrolase domain-containing protein n=1 Tax=Acidibrevibacterium fodinaquatile TaxID=1969806 RepID=UPI000E0DA9CA|nr:serine hydrolase domain-containing protein [Acidibrevibacterium fodinaquatile]
MTAAIDALLENAVTAGDVPGVVALAADDRGVIYQGAFGRRGRDGEAPMTPDSVFWLASMTKAITSVAAMQLVEEGKLALDAPIARVLPELAERPVLAGFDDAGQPRLRPARQPITLRHLLTHTAGFGYDMWNAEIGRVMAQAGVPHAISRRRAALQTPLLFDPGERWTYGVNTDFVGRAVEAVSGRTLQAHFRDHILGPLGMNDTDFILTPAARARRVLMHQRQADGSLAPIDFEPTEPLEFFMGGGGLFGTAGDYLRFLRMLLAGGTLDGVRILRPETVALMAENQIGDLEAGILRTVQPALSNDVDFFPGMRQKWGLGFLINTEDSPQGRKAGSLAWAGLGNTYFWIDRTANLTGVILMQILPFADQKAVALYGAFERALYQGRMA